MAQEHDHGKRDEEMLRSVEFEMTAKRAEWQRNRDKFRSVRMLSFSFLSLVIVGALIGLFMTLTRINEVREERTASSPSPTISPHSPPPR